MKKEPVKVETDATVCFCFLGQIHTYVYVKQSWELILASDPIVAGQVFMPIL